MKTLMLWLPKFSAWLRTPASMGLWLSHGVFLAVLGLQAAGLLEPLELTAYDQGLRLRPVGPPDPRIVLIAETEADLQRWGYPLPDAVLAEALQRLNQAGAHTIGVDKFRDRPVPPGAEQLSATATANVFWIMQFGTDAKTRVDPPPFLNGLDQVGFSDFPVDRDGIIRRALLFLDDGQTAYSALALQLALYYLRAQGITPQPGFPNPEHLRLGPTTIPPLEAAAGGYHHADVAGYQYLLDFRGLAAPFATYTLSELLDGRAPDAALRGRIILIGTFADSLKDHLYIPPIGHTAPDSSLQWFGSKRLNGVEVHALAISQLLRFAQGETRPIRSLAPWQQWLWCWFWCLMGGGLGYRASSPLRFGSEIAVALIGLAIVDLAALGQSVWLPVGSAALGLVAAAGAVIAYLSVHERHEKQALMQMFARHVSPEVAESLWESRDQYMQKGRPQPQRLTATVLFSDIEGFTTISETLEPQILFAWLNGYLDVMAGTVITRGGIVNKYIGDAVMAIFGAPLLRATEAEIALDALRAVNCALDMGEALQRLNAQWAREGLPVIRIRIGIYTGALIAGSIGSDQRLEYTVIGDTVNIAARLESFSKRQGEVTEIVERDCRILIGEATQCRLGGGFHTQVVGAFPLKGRQEAITIHQVFGRL